MGLSKVGAVAPRAISEIDALLALGSQQAPQANAYEFQSSSVVDMLEKMRLKFQDEKLALEKAELNSKAMASRWHQGTIAPRALKKNEKQIWAKMPKSKS